MKRLLTSLLECCLWLTGFSVCTFAQFTSSPFPEDTFINNIGIQLVPWVSIPNSPINGAAPRLNMLKEVPDGTGRMFTVDQRGYMYVIQPDGEVSLYMDIRDHFADFYWPDSSQSGLTSFAFHPEFSQNGKFYTAATTMTGTGIPDFPAKRPIHPGHGGDREPPFHELVLEWKVVDPSANTFSGTVRTLFRVEEPYKDHNIGELGFNPYVSPGDPDYGLLFIPIGDGGNNWPFQDPDPEDNGQDLTTALGSVFRINPLGTDSQNGLYGIPEDNPFASGSGPELREIWTYGHRNPHRISWDSVGDHALYLFEIGQTFFEEINRLEAGANYGWGEREGTFLLQNGMPPNLLYPLSGNDASFGYTYPVAQYHHFEPASGPSNGAAISGGFVYRGSEIPQLYGKMLFADFTENSRMLYANTAEFDNLAEGTAALTYRVHVYNELGVEQSLSRIIRGQEGQRTDVRLGQDLAGNLYVCNKHNGIIYRVKAPPGEPVFELPERAGFVGKRGGVMSIQMDTSATADWNTEPLDDWLKVIGTKSRVGSSTVRVEAAPLPDDVTERSGTIVLAGLEFTVMQKTMGISYDYFPESEPKGGSRFTVSWWGEMDIAGWPWIYIEGWKYVHADSTPRTLYIYDFQLGWLCMSPDYYPWYYSYETETWIYID